MTTNLRTAEFREMTKARLKCEGSCESHEGDPRLVSVTDAKTGNDWGYFKYCDAAIADDESHGLVVTIEDES